jgi:hypothetical protein
LCVFAELLHWAVIVEATLIKDMNEVLLEYKPASVEIPGFTMVLKLDVACASVVEFTTAKALVAALFMKSARLSQSLAVVELSNGEEPLFT